MAWQTWVILGLIVLNWFTYTYPDKAKGLVGVNVWDKVNNFIKVKNPLNNNENSICPDTIAKVCGNGVTYDNICKAALAGVLETTPGEC